MKGKILNYDTSSQTGIISGDDGNRYHFSHSEWKSKEMPTSNYVVDFEVSEKNAVDIYKIGNNMLHHTNINQEKSQKKIISALLALFLGVLGVHKFYLGYKKQGFIMLGAFIFGWILVGIPSIIVGVIAFIEFILYIIKPDDVFEETYIKNKKPWF